MHREDARDLIEVQCAAGLESNGRRFGLVLRGILADDGRKEADRNSEGAP